jgi:type II secretory pathway pseudopilin PulG
VRERERGFTLVEYVIGAAIASVMLLLAVAFSSLDVRVQSSSAAERLAERLETEAASAWAVYAPGPSEVDFFSEDGSHRAYTWSYAYDAATKMVARSSGERFGPFDSFSVTAVSVAQLGAIDPLFSGARATPVTYRYAASAQAIGGNALVDVHVAGSGVDRTMLLASATAPTTFTVVVNYTPSPAPVPTATPTPLVMQLATPTP